MKHPFFLTKDEVHSFAVKLKSPKIEPQTLRLTYWFCPKFQLASTLEVWFQLQWIFALWLSNWYGVGFGHWCTVFASRSSDNVENQNGMWFYNFTWWCDFNFLQCQYYFLSDGRLQLMPTEEVNFIETDDELLDTDEATSSKVRSQRARTRWSHREWMDYGSNFLVVYARNFNLHL